MNMDELLPALLQEPEALLRALSAVDRLNSHIRSQAFQSDYPYGGPARHIYSIKREALLTAHQAGLCRRHLPIRVETTCNRCGGTGIYEDGYTHGDCHKCWHGTATLKFWESRIEGVGTWHTPVRDFPWQIEEGVRIAPERVPLYEGSDWIVTSQSSSVWYRATDWTVRQEGRALTLGEFCRDLNTAEEAITRRVAPCFWESGWWGDAILDPHHWRLFLGEDRPLLCPFCGAETCEKLVCVYSGPIAWRTLGCPKCAENFQRIDHPEDSPPETLLSECEVRRWINRNRPIYAERKALHERLFRHHRAG